MAFALNPRDGTSIYFEDDGGAGEPVLLHGGFLDSVAETRQSPLARSLGTGEFRLVFADHRGLGRSDKPHAASSYVMEIRTRDGVAVLDALEIQRAHWIGLSWGGRLVFGVAEHAPERVLSIVAVGQQPYQWPDSPLTRAVSEGLEAARSEGTVAVVDALARFWGVDFPLSTRARWSENDPIALAAMWQAALTEGPVSRDLGSWPMPCLICVGSADADFIDGARRAASEIPRGRFVALGGADHYAAHVSEADVLVQAVLETLRGAAVDARE